MSDLTLYPADIAAMSVGQLAALPPAQKAEISRNLDEALAWLKQARAKFDAALEAAYGEQARAARLEAGKDFGVVHLKDGLLRVTVDVPKRVSWDQAQLAAIARRIAAAGEKVEDYLDVEFSVSESHGPPASAMAWRMCAARAVVKLSGLWVTARIVPHPVIMSAPTRPRTVLVTGAARRLGRSIALALAAGGWQVAVHYRNSKQDAIETVAACAELAGASAHFDADFDDESAVRALLPRVAAHFGGVDAVVNSASLFEHDTAQTFGFAALEQHLRSNTAAPVLLAQALHAHLEGRGDGNAQGAVVNLLDQKLWNPNPDFFSYTLSKAALEAAGTLLAQALAPRVRVVGVAPGLTLTSHMLSPERFAQLHALSPLGRSSTPEDVAATVRFALENGSITGTTLLVDGGQHLMRFERDFSLM